ncbi:MAG: ATP-binding protein [Nocardioidaceae bacterium]
MLRIRLLGEQVVADETSGTVRTRSSRTLALLGYLAFHANTPQNRQRIAGRFWPDSTDAQALTNLRRELHQLRALLGEAGADAVTVGGTDLTWHDTPVCEVDLRVLETARERALEAGRAGDRARLVEQAAAGIEAYGGELLPAVYDEWVAEPREQLRRHLLELCDLVAETGTGYGDRRLHVAAARKRIAEAPLEEVGYRTLMALQAEMGDRAGAISTYHRCAAVLDRELGVVPEAATRAALERLVRGNAPRAAPPGTRGRTAAAAPAHGGVPLVGQEASLAALTAAWERSAAGRAGAVVVRGAAGVGKSRLVEELADQVTRSGGHVARAQCLDTSGRLALAPVADWLRTPALRTLVADLDPVWAAEVRRLLPEAEVSVLPERTADRAMDRAMVDAWQRHRFFEGLAQVFLRLGRPLLLVLEDLQWCDEETLVWVSFLLGLARDHPVMVATTLRDADGTTVPHAVDWAARLRRTGHLEEVPLEPLDPERTAALAAAVTGRLPDERALGLLHATTGGFPLYVIEASRVGIAPSGASGDGLDALLRGRIAVTSPAAQQVAGLAAAFGREVTIDLLVEAGDLDAESVSRAVDELWSARIVREGETGYRFSHDLLRKAAYERVSPPRRWLLHRRLAETLDRSPAGGTDAVAGALAEQYELGGRPELALPHYRRAAEIAAGRFAFTEAIRLDRRALAMAEAQPPGEQRDRSELDCLLATAAPLNAVAGYASPDLRDVLERAVLIAERIGPDTRLVSSLLGLWASRFVRGEIRSSYATISRALQIPDLDDSFLGQAHFGVAGSTLTLGRPAEAVAHFDIAHVRCEGAESLAVGSRPEVHALAWAAHAHWLLGDDARAAECADDAVQRARAIGHPYSLAVALAYGALTEQLLGARPAAARTVAELRQLGERYGFAYYPEWARIIDGWLRGGPAGLELVDSGIARLRAEHSMARMPYWLSLRAEVLVGEHRLDEARTALDAARICAASNGDTWWLPEVLRARAVLADGAQRDRLLDTARGLARRQGSRALVDRCDRSAGAQNNDQNAPDAGVPGATGLPGAAFVVAPERPNAGRTRPS